MAYYVTVSGIDGSGKSTAFKQVSARLSGKHGYTVIQVRRSAWVDRPQQERKYFGNCINGAFDAAHFWADRRDMCTFTGLTNLLYAPVSKVMNACAETVYRPDFF